MVYQFFDQKKQDQQQKQTNCQVKNYTNQRIKNSKDEKSMLGLKIIFGQQILLKQDHYLLLIVVLNIFYVWQTFSLTMHESNLWKIKSKAVLHSFIEIINESKRKPNKSWVDQEKEFNNNFMQKWLDNNYILNYSSHNEGK